MGIINYLLRSGTETDCEALQALLASNHMETNIDPCEFLLAEVEGQIVGAARLEYEAQAAYIRPIVVDSKWHGKDIGRALLKSIAQGVPDLHVVARGEAIGFYRKLGFLPISWDQVPERYRQECNSCPDIGACQPLPMVLTCSEQAGAQSSDNKESPIADS